VVIIDKIDDLSYYAQASLRRTMEKYANTCKFIFISNQLSKINEPLKSRCLVIRVPLPTDIMVMNIILTISTKEKLNLSFPEMKEILERSENNITKTIWMLEMKKFNVSIDKGNWTDILDTIVELITSYDNYSTKNMLEVIKTTRELLYILFITNIDFHLVIRKLMILFIEKIDCIDTKYKIIDTTSVFELRIAKGTRYIIQMEAYLIQIISILNNKYIGG
jgi:replication factor C subunit 3/5